MATERTLQQATIDTEAVQLRSRGATYPEIARTMSCSISTAYERVQRALRSVPAEAVADMRLVEAQRLDDLWKIAWREATRDHALIADGKVVKDDDGVRLVNHAAKLQAVNTLIRIQERRARLFGLDEPVTQRIEVLTEDVMDRAMRELNADIAEREAADTRSADAY